MNAPKTLAVAQLLRLPNVFTANADILLGTALCGALLKYPLPCLLLLLGSACLYLAGMAFNDYFDREEDARTQRHRPIPSGRIQARTAFLLGLALMLFGVGLCSLAPVLIEPSLSFLSLNRLLPLLLVVLILLYDGPMKQTVLGPVFMGACRFVHVLMAALLLPMAEGLEAVPWHTAAVVGVYIIGVTWFARTEETQSQRWQLMAAVCVMALAVLLAATLPVHYPAGAVGWPYLYLLIGFVLLVGGPVLRGVRHLTPRAVQQAVKRSVLGLVLLDAVLAFVALGWYALLIALLLLPAAWLGRKVYST